MVGEARGLPGGPPCSPAIWQTMVPSVGDLNQCGERGQLVLLPPSLTQPLTVPSKPSGLLAGFLKILGHFQQSRDSGPPVGAPIFAAAQDPIAVTGASAQTCCGHERVRGQNVPPLTAH